MNKLLLLSWLTLLPLSLSGGQIIFDYIDNEWPDDRYIVHGDGTVTDTATSLMWLQCLPNQTYTADSSYGTCSNNIMAGVYWEDALEEASNYVYATYSDWRIPNIKEFASIIAYDRMDPPLNSNIFIGLAEHVASSKNNEEEYYWSTTVQPYSNVGPADAQYMLTPRFSSHGDSFTFGTRHHSISVGYATQEHYTLVRTVE